MRNPFNHNRVYVLRLQNDCWYVGFTSQLAKRIKSHCRINCPIPHIRSNPVIALERVFFDGDYRLEHAVTMDLVKLYGINYVRGGSFTRHEPYKEDFAKQIIDAHELIYVKEFL